MPLEASRNQRGSACLAVWAKAGRQCRAGEEGAPSAQAELRKGICQGDAGSHGNDTIDTKAMLGVIAQILRAPAWKPSLA